MKYITFSKKNTQSNFAVNQYLYRNAILKKLAEQKQAINAYNKIEAAAEAGREAGELAVARQNLAKANKEIEELKARLDNLMPKRTPEEWRKANKIEDLEVVSSGTGKTPDVVNLGGPTKNKQKKTATNRGSTFDRSKHVYVEGFGYAEINGLVSYLKSKGFIPHNVNPTKDQLEKFINRMQKGNRHGNPKGRQGKQNGNNNKSAFNPLA